MKFYKDIDNKVHYNFGNKLWTSMNGDVRKSYSDDLYKSIFRGVSEKHCIEIGIEIELRLYSILTEKNENVW